MPNSTELVLGNRNDDGDKKKNVPLCSVIAGEKSPATKDDLGELLTTKDDDDKHRRHHHYHHRATSVQFPARRVQHGSVDMHSVIKRQIPVIYIIIWHPHIWFPFPSLTISTRPAAKGYPHFYFYFFLLPNLIRSISSARFSSSFSLHLTIICQNRFFFQRIFFEKLIPLKCFGHKRTCAAFVHGSCAPIRSTNFDTSLICYFC